MTKCYQCNLEEAGTCNRCLSDMLRAREDAVTSKHAARVEALERVLRNIADGLEHTASVDGLRSRTETRAMIQHYALQARAAALRGQGAEGAVSTDEEGGE